MAINTTIKVHYNFDDECLELIDPITDEVIMLDKVPNGSSMLTGREIDVLSFLSRAQELQEHAKDHASIVYWNERYGDFSREQKFKDGDVFALCRELDKEAVINMAEKIKKGN